VYPELTTAPDAMTKDCAGCHVSGSSGAPTYLAPKAEGSYKRITTMFPQYISNPANSKFLNHGEHTRPAMYPQLKEDETAWSTQEHKERGMPTTSSSTASGGPPPITESDALAQFGACMDYQEWLADGMDKLAKMQTGLGECNGCHTTGTGGNWLSLNKQET